MQKIITRIGFFVVIFVLSFFIWYSPALLKGDVPYKINESLPLAKNIYQTGLYSLENSQNIFLSSSLIKQEGEISSLGNKFTAYFYAWVFKVVGLLSPQGLILFAILLNALTLVIFSLAVWRLFGLKVSVIFSALYVFMPFVWSSIYSLGNYEFGVLFVSLFFLFFVLGRDSRYSIFFYSMAGLWLALAAIVKEPFLLLIPIVIVYLWFRSSRKAVWACLVPIILVLAVFYLPNFFDKDSGNVYSLIFFSGGQRTFSDYNSYGHLYPDPYTYHFDRQNFLAEYNQGIKDSGFIGSLQLKKVLANLGEARLSIFERLSLGVVLLATHLSYFVSLKEVGGPLILFLMMLGFLYLKGKDKRLSDFFILWVAATVFLLSFVVLVNRSHLRDFSWLLPLLGALGICFLADALKEKIKLPAKAEPLFWLVLLGVFVYHLALMDRLNLGRLYEAPESPKIEAAASQLKKMNIPNEKIIALGFSSQGQLAINYLADKSTIIFSPETINRLSREGKLAEAFKKFNVSYAMGFSDELSAVIASSTPVQVISVSSQEEESPRASSLKIFLLNLAK